MADAVAVDTWDAAGVRLSDVVSALADLRHQSREAGSPRTTVMTLVAVAGSDDQAYEATKALRSLGGHHPARIVILRPDPDQAASLDARAALYSVGVKGHEVNFEQLTLTVRGQAANHLDSVVEPFTVSDLPVAVWYVGSVPEATDPLVNVASTVIVDSRDAADSGRLRSLLELARRRTVTDLSWIRLRPWRVLLASMFDETDRLAWLDGVKSLTVRGKVGPRQMLGGWAAAQLGLLPRQVNLEDSRHVEMQLTCTRDGSIATFEVGRSGMARVVAARAVISGVSTAEQLYPLAEEPLPTALSEALTRLDPDVVWERALSSATLVGPSGPAGSPG